MRLHPPVSRDEALAWLSSQAQASFDMPDTPQLREALTPLAEAMAAVSAEIVPDELEPEFP